MIDLRSARLIDFVPESIASDPEVAALCAALHRPARAHLHALVVDAQRQRDAVAVGLHRADEVVVVHGALAGPKNLGVLHQHVAGVDAARVVVVEVKCRRVVLRHHMDCRCSDVGDVSQSRGREQHIDSND